MEKEGKLKVAEGFLSTKSFTLSKDDDFHIGRTRRCSLPIMSRRVSRQHAKISYNKGVFSITDLNSKTGTLVNNTKITMTVLRNNDLIQVADVKLRFLLEDSAPAREKAPEKPVVIPPRPTPPPPAPKEKARGVKTVKAPEFSEEELRIIGETIGGVKLIVPLAKGRRTLIYKGIHSGRNRVVAFKILNPLAAKDPAIISWFVAGTQQGRHFRHEDTVVALGGGRDSSVLYAYEPFMEHGSAREQFAQTGKGGLVMIKRALESLVHVARALEFAESKGTFHLGLRPSKILYNENHRAKLCGLGYDNGPGAPGAEITVDVAAYLAPEQVTGTKEATPTTDIFSLGATFYYMLTRRLPNRDVRHRIGSPKLVNELVPDSICRIIEKMLDPDPAKRYDTYGQLIHDVRWALRGEAWPRM